MTASQRAVVWVLDDEPGIRRLLALTLGLEGYVVETFPEGTPALEALRGTGPTPDVVVLDLNMPGMDGRTFLRQARAEGMIWPVVIVSAFGARAACDELHAEGAVEKPFHPEDVVEAVASARDKGRV